MSLIRSLRANAGLRRTVVMALAGTLIALWLVFKILGVWATAGQIMLIAASVIAVIPIAWRAWQALRVRTWSIDLLVTIAVTGALIIGDYFEAAAVSFLFLFGAWLEGRTLAKARQSVQGLVDMSPTVATVLRDGQPIQVDADDVEVGDIVAVTTGERIAVDGIVRGGSAEVDEASITGEPVPVSKEVGSKVHASTIVARGFLEIRATEVGDETTFGRIVELVEDALESRTRGAQFLDRFARIYTPAVIVASILVFIITRNAELALVFLVIACPGALVISVPVAAVAGLGNAARRGVLIKSGDALESMAKTTTVVFDKTGTLTVGRPQVLRVEPAGTLSADRLLELAASVELGSEHHLGAAVVAAAGARGIDLERATDVDVQPGLGIYGVSQGSEVGIGRTMLLSQRGTRLTAEQEARIEELEDRGEIVLAVAIDGEFAGLITVADQARPGAADAIAQLRSNGVRRVIMLTGDSEGAARTVSTQLGTTQWQSRMLPHQKAEFVKELQADGEVVAMVGDGVNDAPSLALANVGVAMGQGGTDVSMETAGVVLLGDDLDQLAHAHLVTRATMRIMKQNTALSLVTVAALIVAVLAGTVGLAGGMLVHEISVLLVIVNALRLTRTGKNRVTKRLAETAPRELVSNQ